jgi:hypothetical protein
MSRREAALANVKRSAQDGKLIIVGGTGVSLALTNGKNASLSWRGLVADGFEYATEKGKMSAEQKSAWKAQLSSDDIDELLSAAEFMGRKLEAPSGDLYARWLETVFKNVVPENGEMIKALRKLHGVGIPFCTLNYDQLLERAVDTESINIGEIAKVAEWVRREHKGILHLHGAWNAPTTCVLGSRDYEATLNNSVRDLIQRNLSSFSTLLFIGCGDTFADPNFSTLIKWLRAHMSTAAPQHYALVAENDVARRNADHSWQGFVEPISFGPSQADLPTFLLKNIATTQPNPTRQRRQKRPVPRDDSHNEILQGYLQFLLKDCGQLTMEGMRADLDIAQRRFDLERLYVPLALLAIPPEIPESDPNREEKLQKWYKKNGTSAPFGQVFAKNKRMALLALPGGGKSLLLKRVAVAYADKERRKASEDNLPDLDLFPVMIRCREWKEYIQRPIPTLLRNISTITGQAFLSDFYEALIPLLKRGRVLLLVDGLDEIHNDGERATFVDHLESFLVEYKQVHMIVTSREAGFDLVAPSIARFCKRWRVAPLDEGAIEALCNHWHRLMVGDIPEAREEAAEVSSSLLENESLHRLAENPLLLTMLLVVKHGAGRLPPDRVSLYGRAVEVLLDTWNIKGHAALKTKEAVPQIACLAFELMRQGKQTATENEALAILEEAREKIPQIRRYAEDTPNRFLRRVELRSSLLLEAGHQLDGGVLAPFYQFRHLTFQEYLAAVAAVEGYYLEHQQSDTVLTPLANYLKIDEWKEVVPMAAVLAKKEAEYLFAELVKEGKALRKRFESGGRFDGIDEWRSRANILPSPISRLIHCLAEEAAAAPETLTAALELIVYFGRGCESPDPWTILSRGPYGDELLHQAWFLYSPMQTPTECLVRNTFAFLAFYKQPLSYWESEQGHRALVAEICSEDPETICRGLVTVAAILWGRGRSDRGPDWQPLLAPVERQIMNQHKGIWAAAAWASGRLRAVQIMPPPPTAVLDRLLSLCTLADGMPLAMAHLSLSRLWELPRSAWTPALTPQQREFFKENFENTSFDDKYGLAIAVVAFHSDLFTDDELADRLSKIGGTETDWMLRQLGPAGDKQLMAREKKRQKLRPRRTEKRSSAPTVGKASDRS